MAPPRACYRPQLRAKVLADGILPDAQLETIIYAREAHSELLTGSSTVDATFDVVAAARDDPENAVRFSPRLVLGGGTGAGKGGQVSRVLLDNWLKGRRRAVAVRLLLRPHHRTLLPAAAMHRSGWSRSTSWISGEAPNRRG